MATFEIKTEVTLVIETEDETTALEINEYVLGEIINQTNEIALVNWSIVEVKEN